ncbi:MAG: transglycosylase family protein [Solirubrobacterales bacterium]
MLARRNLIAAVGVVFLSLGASVAWAAGDELTGAAGERSELLDRSERPLERAIDGHRERQARRERRQERQERRGPEWSAEASADAVAGVPRDTLEGIASCESGGDPTAVSSDGTYRGKYQFDTGTWASVGGSGDPAAAPEAEQDYRAALLYSQSGSSPWPVCG